MSLGRVYVAGHRGMVGAALHRLLASRGAEVLVAGREELDLTDQGQVSAFLRDSRPDTVVVAAARVGGIWANSQHPAEFGYENLSLATNLIHGSHVAGVGRLLFLGSACIYPRDAPQPMAESALLSGPLESTNEPYAIAKIAGLKLCEYYRRQYGAVYHSAMPTNLYGTGDNYHRQNSHVVPGLIRKFHEAKETGSGVTLWGSGSPLREFLHVEDCASALMMLLELEDPPDLVNVGSGEEVSIRELAGLVGEAVGYAGDVSFDPSKPDGTPRKLLDSSLLRGLGWSAQIGLTEGLARTYGEFVEGLATGSLRES